MPVRQVLELGWVLATRRASELVPATEMQAALARHAAGDWGVVGDEDRIANDEALRSGDRLLSVHLTTSGVRFWIITEADRSATTVLLPEEY